MSIRRPAILLAALTSLSCGSTSGSLWSKVRMKPFEFRMRDFQAPSGLRVIIEEDHFAPVAGIVTVVGVGSTSDPEGKEGLAHLVEHMAFRMRPFADSPSSFWELLSEAGAGRFNASTDLDATVYYEFGPRQALGRLLRAEGARMVDAARELDQQVFETEREVVRNELRERGETRLTSSAFGWMQAALYPPGHPYHRPVIGTHESLSRITLEDVRRFVGAHYRLDNMTMFIVGDVDLAQVGRLLAQSVPFLYGDPARPSPAPVRRVSSAPAPPPDSPAHPLYRYEGPVATPELWIGWALPGAYQADDVLLDFVAWLTETVVTEAHYQDDDIASVTVDAVPGIHSTMLLCRVLLREGSDPERSATHILDQLYQAWAPGLERGGVLFPHGPEAAAVELALSAEDLASRAEQTALGVHFTGDPAFFGRRLEALARLEQARIPAYAHEYVTRERARALYITPLPASRRAGGRLTGLRAVPEDGAEARTPQHTLEEIRSLVTVPGFAGFRDSRLPNGLEVVVAPRSSIPAVTVQLGLHGGRGAGGQGVADLSEYIARAHSTRHGSPFSYGGQLSHELTADRWVLQLRAGSGNLPSALASLADRVTSMEVPADRFRLVQKWVFPVVRKIDAHPDQRGDRAFWRALFGRHPYGWRASAEDLEQLAESSVEEWLDQMFAPRNGVLAIVGDVQPAAAEALAQDWLGGWSSQAVEVPPPPPAVDRGRGLKRVVVHRPGASQGELRLGCLLPAATPRQAVLYEVMARLVADRFFHDVRQQLGASYGFSPQLGILRGGSAYLLTAGNIDNASLPSALAAIQKAWDGFPQGQFSDREVNRVRYDLALRFNLRFTTSESIANEIIRVRNLGWPLESVDRYGEELISVGREELTRAFAACHDSAVLTLVGDELTISQALESARWD
jgi:zinc protease